MGLYSLADRSILLVEDEPLIALDLAELFSDAGAEVLTVATIADAVLALEQHRVSAAVLDYVDPDGVAVLGRSLRDRNIPWMFYSGRCELETSFPGALVVPKPAPGEMLVGAVAGLLQPTPAAAT